MDDVGQALNDLTWRLMHFPLPTVAAVNGKFLHKKQSTPQLLSVIYE